MIDRPPGTTDHSVEKGLVSLPSRRQTRILVPSRSVDSGCQARKKYKQNISHRYLQIVLKQTDVRAVMRGK
jgi:ribosomal protein S10